MHRLLILIALVSLGTSTGCSDWTYGRTLEGEVVNAGSRMKAGQQNLEQKISLLVKATGDIDSKINEVACGPSGCAVECLSTRCAGLVVNTCHRFQCKFDHREGLLWGGEPNVIGCKHDKEIECVQAKAKADPKAGG